MQIKMDLTLRTLLTPSHVPVLMALRSQQYALLAVDTAQGGLIVSQLVQIINIAAARSTSSMTAAAGGVHAPPQQPP
jgi:hypothetical protein